MNAISRKILLIGCGQLGTRHLQAVALQKSVGEVHVIDPNAESLELGRSRLKEVAETNNAIKYFWHETFDDAIPNGELCIIASQAKDRPDLLKTAFKKYGYKK